MKMSDIDALLGGLTEAMNNLDALATEYMEELDTLVRVNQFRDIIILLSALYTDIQDDVGLGMQELSFDDEEDVPDDVSMSTNCEGNYYA